jgi:hypothetical protein
MGKKGGISAAVNGGVHLSAGEKKEKGVPVQERKELGHGLVSVLGRSVTPQPFFPFLFLLLFRFCFYLKLLQINSKLV